MKICGSKSSPSNNNREYIISKNNASYGSCIGYLRQFFTDLEQTFFI